MNIAGNIERGSRFFPDKAAIVFEERSITYTELNAQTNRVANALRAAGVQAGDRVALFLPNIPEFAVVYLGTLKRGAIAVSLNSMLKPAEVEYIINDSDFKVWPAEVEHTLYEHPAIHEAAVFGVADDTRDECVHAHIVLKPGQKIAPEELSEYCRARMATYKVPAKITLVDALPKSATGKVLKRIMREC
ncbi:MAG: AMP-binding protein [Anaerolineales bacterium]|jgi:acyl-CoA synthetase (AMP-forming)/AMP-acid ligase II|nr:hypothetical protein [Anaerolineaceae bacterium]MDP6225224.1 AMP-binding protein [Anaerolineales bacterium]MDP7346450.1 AMP-binding protein [Anaerolineales bacterium]MDP7644257.1 AMP-binding protein [Anaerolineales bacterium]HJL70048.1 AMP-binding protein [Anaerolineales bacterium]|tara:strand:- start:703 stop:1272 length:570 start_codon:yes stop_codon:yes gene_type:complete